MRNDMPASETGVDEALAEKIQKIAAGYDEDAGFLIPMMQDLQAQEGYLPADALHLLAKRLDLPLSRLYTIATFYSSFRLAPRGAHTITLCVGTVCYLKGADKVAAAIEKEIGCAAGETSADGRFTFTAVNCLGACALAPVMVIDGKYHSKVKPGEIADILAEYPPLEEGSV